MADAGALRGAPAVFFDAPERFQELASCIGPSLAEAFTHRPEPFVSALATQRWYLARAKEFAEQRGLRRYFPYLQRLEYFLDTLEKGEYYQLINVLDWVTKWYYVERLAHRQASKGKPLAYNLARLVDLEYHTIYGGKLGIPQAVWEASDPPWLPEAVQEAGDFPGHRAVVRESQWRG